MLKILDRMVLIELRWPFLFGVAMFSMLIIATVVLQEAARFVIRYPVPPAMFFTLVALASPQFIVLSIPMGVLLGTLIAVGRLTNDQEIVALRACGVSLWRMLLPFLAVGVVLSGITFLGSERIVPVCNSRLKDIKTEVVSGRSGAVTRQRLVWPIYRASELLWLLIATEVEGTNLHEIKLFYFDPLDKENDFYVDAEDAKWEGNEWVFYNMRMVKTHPGSAESDQLIQEAKSFTIPDFQITPETLKLRSRSPDDLSIEQLAGLIHDLLVTKQNQVDDTEIRDYLTRLYFKYSIPLTPLFFIFIALPLAILPQRSTRSTGMGMALLIVLVYYVMYAMFTKLGAAGVVPPAIAAWTPNALMFFVGTTMMQRRDRS